MSPMPVASDPREASGVLGGRVRVDAPAEAVVYGPNGYPVFDFNSYCASTSLGSARTEPPAIRFPVVEDHTPNELAGLNALQARHAEWATRNFGDKPLAHRGAFLGVVEETGELMDALLLPFLVSRLGSLGHSLLKADQNIRGTREENDANAKDAVADITIFLMDLCNRKGWVLGDLLGETAARVHARDWTTKPETGV